MADMNFQNKNKGETGDQSRFDTGAISEKASNVAASVADQAKSMAASVADKARSAASDLGERASDVASSLGQQAQNVAHRVQDTWDSGKHYVEERGFQGMGEDLTSLIRRYPVAALCTGLCLGFFVGRSLRD
jgi:ElaB/YqjD/DUF883 family membrane-anchored ribosome-binding protein